MTTTRTSVELARSVLRGVRLEHLVGDDGCPTDACWDRLEEGALSTGEWVLVAMALALLDYSTRAEWPARISDLMRLDRANLRAVGEALVALAERC